jgi:hypothetical protein
MTYALLDYDFYYVIHILYTSILYSSNGMVGHGERNSNCQIIR